MGVRVVGFCRYCVLGIGFVVEGASFGIPCRVWSFGKWTFAFLLAGLSALKTEGN